MYHTYVKLHIGSLSMYVYLKKLFVLLVVLMAEYVLHLEYAHVLLGGLATIVHKVKV